ncbi:MAG: hypothetical protein LBM94_03930 [Propionibacteriaceae bacterium]|jgi:hypothetical protein|nr:hypothetical protein [Propionibacteriaceae bacterium]
MGDDVGDIESYEYTEERRHDSSTSIVVTLLVFVLGALGFAVWFIDPFGWFAAEPAPSPTATASSAASVSPSPTSAPTSVELDGATLAQRVAAQIPETGTLNCPGRDTGVLVKIGRNAFCDFAPANDPKTHYMVTVTFGSLTSPTDYTLSSVQRAEVPSMALAVGHFESQLGTAIWDKYGGDVATDCGTDLMWIADGLEFSGCTLTGNRADGTRFAPEVDIAFSKVNIATGTYAYSWMVGLVPN